MHEKILETKGDFKKDVVKLEPIFRSFKLNSRILKITDTVVTKFLEDTIVDDEIEMAIHQTQLSFHNMFGMKQCFEY